MKTRRQRKGGTRRVGGIFNAARAAIGNLKNGGGRVLQWNQIINAMSDEGFRMFKGMTVMMGGEDVNDDKYIKLNVKPKLEYMTDVNNRRGTGSATAQITAAAIKGPATDTNNEGPGPDADKSNDNEGPDPNNNTSNDNAGPEPNNNTSNDNAGPEPNNNTSNDNAEPEPGATNTDTSNDNAEPEPEPKAPPKEGGTRKNKRNRI